MYLGPYQDIYQKYSLQLHNNLLYGNNIYEKISHQMNDFNISLHYLSHLYKDIDIDINHYQDQVITKFYANYGIFLTDSSMIIENKVNSKTYGKKILSHTYHKIYIKNI